MEVVETNARNLLRLFNCQDMKKHSAMPRNEYSMNVAR